MISIDIKTSPVPRAYGLRGKSPYHMFIRDSNPTAKRINSGMMIIGVRFGWKMSSANAKISHDQIMNERALEIFWKLRNSPSPINTIALMSIIGVIWFPTTDGKMRMYV